MVVGGPKHVKIGISSDVDKRLQGIQTGCPFKVRLAKSWRTPFARKIEGLAHAALSRYRTAGEWFNVPIRVAMAVVEVLIEAHPRNHNTRAKFGAVLFCSRCRHSATFDSEPELRATTWLETWPRNARTPCPA